MFKKIVCILVSLILLLGILPLGVWAEETGASFTGEPPAVMTMTGGDAKTFIYGGRVWSARTVGNYPNNAPDSIDTVEEKVDWIADQCRAAGVTDPWEIALWLHNWLIYNANYDYTYSNYSADGVLLLGTGVCNSYALAYGLLLDEFGIENMKLDSEAMNHAWNLVKLNGQWCHVDCTWDDPGEGGFENFTYFGMDDELMSRDHYWDVSAYPVCTSKVNYYPTRSGVPVAANKAEMMMEFSNQAANQADVIVCYYIGTDSGFSVFDVFREWYDTFNWKYGIYGWGCTCTDMMISATMSYGTPWSKPDDFDQTHSHCYVAEMTAPTCAEQGFTTYTCPCDYSYQGDYVDPTGKHTYTNATCIDPPICKICGATEGIALGHDWSEWDIVDATCTVDGSRTRFCKRSGCDESETQTIPATGEHVYDQEIADAKYLVSEATSTTLAVYRKSCKCGAAGEETFTVGELNAVEFDDVLKGAYYYDSVLWAVEKKITNGVGDGTIFDPDSGCTRGQIATFLWRAAGEPVPKSTEMPFKDVPADEYFSTAVIWAAENGITTGTGDGTIFEPNATCTRGQIVTFLSRYLKGTPSSNENPFKDVPNGAYYTNAVLWAVEQGITNGVGDGTAFEPDSTCTRGMIVTFLYRALNQNA